MESSNMPSATEGTQNTEDTINSTDIIADPNTMPEINGILVDIEKNAVCAEFTTRTATKSATFLSFSSLCDMAQNPDNKPKEDARVIACQLTGLKKKVPVIEHDQMTLCWIDIDKGNKSLADLKSLCVTYGLESYIIYSSKSSTESKKKWRILIELEKTAAILDWLIFQHSFVELFNGDPAACNVNQIFYAPNAGEYYDYEISKDKALGSDMSDSFRATCEKIQVKLKNENKEKFQQQKVAKEKVAKARSKVKNTSSTGDFTIEKANTFLDTEELLEKHGYTQRGEKWISPNTKQEVSPSAGVVVFDDDHWFSHHSSDVDAGVGHTVDNGGCCGGAFDLVCFYEHQGDADACLAALADEHDPIGQKKRQAAFNYRSTNDIPYGYYCLDDGVVRWAKNKDDKDEQLTTKPISIIAVSRDDKARGWGMLVEWVDRDGNTHKQVFSMDLFSDKKGFANQLRRGGLHICPGKGDKVIDYLEKFNPVSRITTVHRTGWLNDSFVLPTQTLRPLQGEEILFRPDMTGAYAGPVYGGGSLEEWQKLTANVSELVRFLCCASFAAPLLGITGTETWLTHTWGLSGHGKTTANQAPASVWGCGVDPAKAAAAKLPTYIKSWETTTGAIEDTAENYSDLALCFDEIGRGDNVEFAKTIYKLISGTGKDRMNWDLRTWSCVIFSSGEMSASRFIESGGGKVKAGMMARALDLNIGDFEPLFTSAEEADMLKDGLKEHFGLAGPAFIERLDNTNDIAQEWSNFPKESIGKATKPMEIRVRDKMALIAYAGILAVRNGVVLWSEQQVMDCVKKAYATWLSKMDKMDDVEKAASKVIHFCVTQEHRFHTVEKFNLNHSIKDLAGWYIEDTHYLIPKVFDDLCCDVDSLLVKKLLLEKGQFKKLENRFSGRKRFGAFGHPKRIPVEAIIVNPEEKEKSTLEGADSADSADTLENTGDTGAATPDHTKSLSVVTQAINPKVSAPDRTSTNKVAASTDTMITEVATASTEATPYNPDITNKSENDDKVEYTKPKKKLSNPAKKSPKKEVKTDPENNHKPDKKIPVKMNKESFADDWKKFKLIDEIMLLLDCKKGCASNNLNKAKQFLNITGETKFLSASDKMAIYNHIKDKLVA